MFVDYHPPYQRWSPASPESYRDHRWPTPTEVAVSAPVQSPTSGKKWERDSPFDMRSNRCLYNFNQNLPLSTHEDQENYHLQDASTFSTDRSKPNSSSMAKRFKAKLRTGFVEGQVGKLVAEAAIHHDLADVPRMPGKALIGVDGDELHSRDSYISIVNTAIDHARRNLRQGERHNYNKAASSDVSEASDPSPNHISVPKVQPLDPDSYMHLLNNPEDIAKYQPIQQKSHNNSVTLEKPEVRSREKANESQLSNLKGQSRHPTILRPGNRDLANKATRADARCEDEGKTDWRQPIYQPYKGGSFHGCEATKTTVQQKGHTFHATDQRSADWSQFDSSLYPQNRSNEDMSHILDAKLVKAAPLSPTTESELFRNLSNGTRNKKRAYKERRSAVIFGMTDEKMERLKAAGQHHRRGSFSVSNQSPVIDPYVKAPATIPMIRPRNIKTSEDVPFTDEIRARQKFVRNQKELQLAQNQPPTSQAYKCCADTTDAGRQPQTQLTEDYSYLEKKPDGSPHQSEIPQNYRPYDPQAKTFHPDIQPARTQLPRPWLEPGSKPSRTLSQFHRENKKDKAAFPGPTKFVDTHLSHRRPPSVGM